MKLCWVDIRGCGEAKEAIIEESVHQRLDAVVTDDPDDLAQLPPTVTKVLLREQHVREEELGSADIVLLGSQTTEESAKLAEKHPQVEFGRFIEITDSTSLEQACEVARAERWCLLEFRDPTKIPLEIVLAAADSTAGSIITVVGEVREAEIVFDVLERGSDGVMMVPRSVGDATRLKAASEKGSPELEMAELTVTGIDDLGMGDRVCVDTCSHFREDEGILVGSYSQGLVLCSSETHPLPYMPTRPFRVNAGGLHSYTLSPEGRTSYLSELRSGSKVLAVDSTGRTRGVAVGRVKIESRPLLSVDAVSATGQAVNLILQHDWHVRVLGPGPAVLNSTEVRPGDRVLGHLPTAARHVGYAIDEFCLEK